MNYEDLYLQYQLLNHIQVNFLNQLTDLQIQSQTQETKLNNFETKLNNFETKLNNFETKLNNFEKYIN